MLSGAAISLDDCFFISRSKREEKFLFEEFHAIRFNASFEGALFCNISSFPLFKLHKCNYNKVPYRRSSGKRDKKRLTKCWESVLDVFLKEKRMEGASLGLCKLTEVSRAELARKEFMEVV